MERSVRQASSLRAHVTLGCTLASRLEHATGKVQARR
jgi:hypothetical protein